MKRLLIVCAILLVLPSIALAVDCPVPDTGQTGCYDNSGAIACPDPGEAFYGQDAQYSMYPQSYTKLDEDGLDLPDSAIDWLMVRDNITGLIWEVKDSKDSSLDYENPHDADNEYTWYDGDTGTPGDGTDTEDFINALNAEQFGGYSDWRLPAIKELSFIRNIDTYNPAINTDYFPNTVWYHYWSSTPNARNTLSAWLVPIHYGYVHLYYKSFYNYVRAVRGGQCGSFGDFVDNSNGTVIDTDTGLMWQQDTAPSLYSWQDALSYCENLTLAGYNDWRLPNANELQSLVDYSRFSLSIDPVFPNTMSSYYWSSTTNASSTDGAWYVYFLSGYVSYYYKSYGYYIRAVRGGQCGSFGDSDGDTICDDGDDNGTPGDNPCTGGETVGCDDNCPDDVNPYQYDCDNDGQGDVCDPDTIDNDSDGLDDACDNCWQIANPDQADTNDNCPDPPYSTDPLCGDVCENQCQCDFDDDGNVYPSDLSVFLGEYGRTDCLISPPCEADFDDVNFHSKLTIVS